MEEGKVVLSTKEYMELVERTNVNHLLMNEVLNSRQDIEHMRNRIIDLERRLSNIEQK